jgi:putative PIN family toxin of toxin-antitoxin system
MKVFAVIDTNVIVSALLARNSGAATVKVLEAFFQGRIMPLVNDEIINEYRDVLHRPKFRFPKELVNSVIAAIEHTSISPGRTHSKEDFSDPKDAVFYEVALSKDDAYLITGNTKHFPRTPIVVTPAEMLEILERG